MKKILCKKLYESHCNFCSLERKIKDLVDRSFDIDEDLSLMENHELDSFCSRFADLIFESENCHNALVGIAEELVSSIKSTTEKLQENRISIEDDESKDKKVH